MVDLRSVSDEAGFTGVLLDVVDVPLARDIRFAVAEIPLFSSPELATDFDLSSVELAEGRER